MVITTTLAFTGAAISEVGCATADGSSTAPGITHGMTINEGDFIVALVHLNLSTNVLSDNNGNYAFTKDINEQGADTSIIGIYHRVAGASEPSSYAWSAKTSGAWSIQLRVFRAEGTIEYDVAPATGNKGTGSTGTTATAPSISTGADDAVVIAAFFTDSITVTYSAPTNGFGFECQPAAQQAQASYLKEVASASGGYHVSHAPASNDWYALQFPSPWRLLTSPEVAL